MKTRPLFFLSLVFFAVFSALAMQGMLAIVEGRHVERLLAEVVIGMFLSLLAIVTLYERNGR